MIKHVAVSTLAIAALLSCTGCDRGGGDSDASQFTSPIVSSTPTPVPTPTPVDPRTQQIDLVKNLWPSSKGLAIHNPLSQTIVVERLLVNDVVGDSSCDIKVFKELAPGGDMNVPYGDCGLVRKTVIYTDHGYQLSNWSTEPFVNPLLYGSVLTIKNLGVKQYIIQRIVINDLSSRPECDVKVFRELQGDGSIYVSGMDQCGTVNHITIITDKGSKDFDIDNG